MNIKNFISELKRRNVIRVATAYAIAGWLIIQVATSVFPAFEFPDWTTQFVIILTAIGFPISLIIAWAFELTPEGLKKSQEVQPEESITPQTGKKINRIIITGLSLALIFVLTERIFFAESAFSFGENTSIEEAGISIAVLPFVNMSEDKSNEYFSDGLSEELLNGLAKIEEIQVAGRTSSFQFKGENSDLREVGNQLGVQHILEGSVRKSGERVRITAQLIRADNGFHLWSETYDRELTANDIFDIQEEITRKVVSELKVRLLPRDEAEFTQRPTNDIEAYNAYLEATQIEITRNPEDLRKAVAKYNEAIRIDPTFSLAYARLAYVYGLMNRYANLSLEEAKERVRDNIDQALMLDGNQGKAYQALASYHMDMDVDYIKAENAARRAVELLPNDAMANNMLAIIIDNNDKIEESKRVIGKAYELDPLNPIVISNYTSVLVEEEKFEEALNLLDQAIERNPDYLPNLSGKAALIRSAPYGKMDEAFILLHKAYRKHPDNPSLIFSLYTTALNLDLFPVARKYEDQMQQLLPNNRNVAFLGIRSAMVNRDYDRAENLYNDYIEKFGEGTRKDVYNSLAMIYGNQGRYQDAIKIIEEYNPEFTRPQFEVNENNYGNLINYYWYVYLTGQEKRAEALSDLACTYVDNKMDEVQLEGKELEALFLQLQCQAMRFDIEAYTASLEKVFFEKNNKYGIHQALVFNDFLFREFNQYESFIQVYRKIYKDLHGLRANAIEYLKAEGEWKEEWNREL